MFQQQNAVMNARYHYTKYSTTSFINFTLDVNGTDCQSSLIWKAAEKKKSVGKPFTTIFANTQGHDMVSRWQSRASVARQHYDDFSRPEFI
jgi:hypothetical protein